MKKTLHLLMLPWLISLAACSADEPQTISATEDYNREFIKEFGVPAEGHDFSMATTAGLKVTSKNGDHITVTAEIDGEEYLFADCHVPAGTTAIPVTIPRSVSELQIASNKGVSTVAANALVNLDEIAPQMMRVAAAPSPDNNPYIAFKTSELMKPFFEKDKSKFTSTSPSYPNRSAQGYLFPIYWKRDRNGNSDYHIQFATSQLGKNDQTLLVKDMIFDENQSSKNPFPGIKYSPYISDVKDIAPDSYFSTALFSTYSYSPDADYMIVSRGIRIADYIEDDRPPRLYAWYLEVDYGYDAAGNCSVSSESPFRNIAFWNGNYYDVSLKNLKYAHHGGYMFLAAPSEFYIYDTKSSEGTEAGYFRKISCKAYIIGFNTAPSSAAAEDDRDWCDVAFLYVKPGSASSGTISTSSTYKWRIAAEDLGATDDWDFNDAVFEFSDQIRDLNSANTGNEARQYGPRDAQPVRVINVTPRAAGGTMPLYITYTGKVGKVPMIPDGTGQTAGIMYSEANRNLKDYMNNLEYNEGTFIVGKELHAWLGADSYNTIYNTEAKNKNPKPTPVEFVIPLEVEPTLEPGDIWNSQTQTSSTGTLMASTANKTLCGFAVVVDKNNSMNIDAMNDAEEGMHRADNLVLGNGSYVIGRPNSKSGEVAPQMILVNGSWRWPQERVKISDAYPEFPAWLENPASAPTWVKNYESEKVTSAW